MVPRFLYYETKYILNTLIPKICNYNWRCCIIYPMADCLWCNYDTYL